MDNQSKNFYKHIDWAFLGFLIGATYVKLYVKIGVVILYALYQMYKCFRFRKPVSLTWFYFLILFTGTISSALQGSFAHHSYIFAYALGATTWICGGLISYFLYNGIVNLSEEKVMTTIKAFFLFNIAISLVSLLQLMLMSRHLIPYWYWESSEYFGASTGDHIKGLFSSNSITNAMINVLGVVFFIYHKKLRLALACLLVCLLCTSNVTLFVLVSILVLMHLVIRNKVIRRDIRISILVVLILYPILSPLNVKYINTTYSRGSDKSLAINLRHLDSNVLQKKPVIANENEIERALGQYLLAYNKQNYYRPKINDSIFVDYADYIKYALYKQEALAGEGSNVVLKQDFLKATIKDWYGKQLEQTPLSTYYKPIKLYSFIQTLIFLKTSIKDFLFGAGIGNFSSKLAIKITGLNMQGGYPITDIYISPFFVQYHLYTLMYVLALPVSEHSTINMPYSVYNHIGGEYGFIGILLFVCMYIGFIIKFRKRLSYSRYLFLVVLIFFGFEYWFEMLSLTVVFELFLFKDIYKPQEDAR